MQKNCQHTACVCVCAGHGAATKMKANEDAVLPQQKLDNILICRIAAGFLFNGSERPQVVAPRTGGRTKTPRLTGRPMRPQVNSGLSVQSRRCNRQRQVLLAINTEASQLKPLHVDILCLLMSGEKESGKAILQCANLCVAGIIEAS